MIKRHLSIVCCLFLLLCTATAVFADGEYSLDLSGGTAAGWSLGAGYSVIDSPIGNAIRNKWADNNYYGTYLSVYNGNSWSGYYVYRASIQNDAGGDNEAMLLFNYQDPGNYYALCFAGDVEGNGAVKLRKVINGNRDTVLAEYEGAYPVKSPADIVIIYDNGEISARAVRNGVETHLITKAKDTSGVVYESGKIGVGTNYSVGYFGKISVGMTDEPVIEPEPEPEPEPVERIQQVYMPSAKVELENWIGITAEIIETASFNHSLDFSVAAASYGEAETQKALIRFFYKDSGNYYQLAISGGNANGNAVLLKMVSGEPTVLGEESLANLKNAAVRVICSEGRIKVIINSADLFEVTDDTFTSGKIGFGVDNQKCDFANIKAFNPNFGVFEENFSQPDIAKADWSVNESAAVFAEGKLTLAGLSSWTTTAAINNALHLSRSYVYSVDISAPVAESYTRVLFNHTAVASSAAFNYVQFYKNKSDEPNYQVKLNKRYTYHDDGADFVAPIIYQPSTENFRVIIMYELTGHITVDCIDTATGVKSRIFTRVTDPVGTYNGGAVQSTKLVSGKVGVAMYHDKGPSEFSNIRVTEQAFMIVEDELPSLAQNAGETVNIKTVVKNNSFFNDFKGVFMASLTDDNGKVCSVDIDENGFELEDSDAQIAELSVQFIVPEDAETTEYKIKRFYWNTVGGMHPLLW